MTAEERLAYFQGEKRRNTSYDSGKSEKNMDIILFKIKFVIAVGIFVVFLSLDYTEYKIKGIGSEEIIDMVVTDFDTTYLEKLYEAL